MANEDTLLPTQMFLRLPTRDICCRHKKCLWFCSETFCVRNKCFPVCAAWKHNIHFVSRAFARPRNIMSNNVSASMGPCLPGHLCKYHRSDIPPLTSHNYSLEIHECKEQRFPRRLCSLWNLKNKDLRKLYLTKASLIVPQIKYNVPLNNSNSSELQKTHLKSNRKHQKVTHGKQISLYGLINWNSRQNSIISCYLGKIWRFLGNWNIVPYFSIPEGLWKNAELGN